MRLNAKGTVGRFGVQTLIYIKHYNSKFKGGGGGRGPAPAPFDPPLDILVCMRSQGPVPLPCIGVILSHIFFLFFLLLLIRHYMT